MRHSVLSQHALGCSILVQGNGQTAEHTHVQRGLPNFIGLLAIDRGLGHGQWQHERTTPPDINDTRRVQPCVDCFVVLGVFVRTDTSQHRNPCTSLQRRNRPTQFQFLAAIHNAYTTKYRVLCDLTYE